MSAALRRRFSIKEKQAQAGGQLLFGTGVLGCVGRAA